MNKIFNILLSFLPLRVRMILDEVRNGREDKSAHEQNIAIQLDSKKEKKWKEKGKIKQE